MHWRCCGTASQGPITVGNHLPVRFVKGRMRRTACFAIVGLLSLAACSDESASTRGAERRAGIGAEQLTASCGVVEFATIPADPSAFPPADEHWNEVDLSEAGKTGAPEFFDRYDWTIAEQTEQELTIFGHPINPIPDYDEYGAAHFQRQAGRWVLESDGWGECRIELTAPGYLPAHFVLDPHREPDPADTSIAVVAHEVGCASGISPGGRDVESIVVAEDEASVSIVVLVEPPTGGQTCPGNPPIPLEVNLGSALADRTVYDGGVQPAMARPWPPTQSSLSTNGQVE